MNKRLGDYSQIHGSEDGNNGHDAQQFRHAPAIFASRDVKFAVPHDYSKPQIGTDETQIKHPQISQMNADERGLNDFICANPGNLRIKNLCVICVHLWLVVIVPNA